MLFNSIEFLLFFPVVFVLYWSVGRRSGKAQNVVLLLASFLFYGSADPRSLVVLLLSATVNFLLGIGIASRSNERAGRWLLWLGVAINVGVLFWFKYFDFFSSGFIDLLSAFGFQVHHATMAVLLPVGISFFTFQILGYLIDVHNEEIQPCRDPLLFFTYIFYFPKILAGPIERAQKFLPQIAKSRPFDRAMAFDGCRQILWGLFAKIVIADNCERYVGLIFDNHHSEAGSTLLLGAFLNIIQIYCDFSGYSNIALGVSKLLGIRLMVNFATPFFATNISEFWQRWHISLTTWMMDYIFTPLSFILRQHGRLGSVIAILITFLAVGLWHGGRWTFVLFGVLQSLYFIPLVLSTGLDRASSTSTTPPSPRIALKVAGTFTLVMLTAILLRASTVPQAAGIFISILSPSLFDPLGYLPWGLLAITVGFLFIEWSQRGTQHALQRIMQERTPVLRVLFFYALIVMVLWNVGKEQEFIYFQF